MPKNLIEFILDAKDRASAKVDKAGGRFAKLKGKLSALAGPAGIAAGAIVGIATAAVGAAAKTAAFGDTIAKNAAKIGASSEELSTLAFAAERSGANFGQLMTSMRALNRKAAEAAGGNEAVAKSFRDLGVEVQDANGNIKDSPTLLKEIADKIKALPNDSERAAKAFRVFEASGVDLLPMLKAGGDGIEEMQQRARDLGMEMSSKTAADSEEFQDAMQDLTSSLKGVGMEIGAVLIPIITKLVNWFVDALPYIRKFGSGVVSVFKAIPDFVTDIFARIIELSNQGRDKILAIYQKLAGGIDWIVEKVTGKSLGIAEKIEEIRERARKEGEATVEHLRQMGEGIRYVAEEDVAPSVDKMGGDFEGLAGRVEASADRIVKATKKIERPPLPEVWFDPILQEQAEALGVSIDGLTEAEARQAIETAELEDRWRKAEEAGRELGMQVDLMRDSGQSLAEVEALVGTEAEDATRKLEAEADAVRRFGSEAGAAGETGVPELISSVRTLTSEFGLTNDALEDVLGWIEKIIGSKDLLGDVGSALGSLFGGGGGGGGGGGVTGWLAKKGLGKAASWAGEKLGLGSILGGGGTAGTGISLGGIGSALGSVGSAIGSGASAVASGAGAVLGSAAFGALAATAAPIAAVAALDKLFGQDPRENAWTQQYAAEQRAAERWEARRWERQRERRAAGYAAPRQETPEDIFRRGGTLATPFGTFSDIRSYNAALEAYQSGGVNGGAQKIEIEYVNRGVFMGNEADAQRTAREIQEGIETLNRGEVVP